MIPSLDKMKSLSEALMFIFVAISTAEVRTRSFNLSVSVVSLDDLLPCLLSCMENGCAAVSPPANGKCQTENEWHPEMENVAAFVEVCKHTHDKQFMGIEHMKMISKARL